MKNAKEAIDKILKEQERQKRERQEREKQERKRQEEELSSCTTTDDVVYLYSREKTAWIALKNVLLGLMSYLNQCQITEK